MSDQVVVPSENRIKAQLARQLRLYGLTARPEAATAAFDNVMDHLASLFDQGKITPSNTMQFVDERVNLIVDTALQLTKDQKSVTFLDQALMEQIIAIIQSFTLSQPQQQQHGNNNDGLYGQTQQSNQNNKVVNDNVNQAIKYFTLQQTQPVFLLDPFNIAKFSFSTHQNQYLPNTLSLYSINASAGGNGANAKNQVQLHRLGHNQQLHASAPTKAGMFTSLYHSIYQRLQRQERYAQQQRQVNGKGGNSGGNAKGTTGLAVADSTKIYEVDSLQGTEGELTVFGFISDIIGEIYLESPTARILLDLSNAVLIDTNALKRAPGLIGGDNEAIFTTYTHNTQISEAIHQVNATQTPTKYHLTPAKVQQTRSPSRFSTRHRDGSGSKNDLNDQSIVDHSSVFAKLFGVGCFVLITGYTINNIFLAKRCQLPQHESRQSTLELFPALAVINPYTDYLAHPLQHFPTYFSGKILQHHINKLLAVQSQMAAIVTKNGSSGALSSNAGGNGGSSSSALIDINAQIKNQKLLLESLLDTTQGHSLDRIIILGECYLHDQATLTKIHAMLAFLEIDPPKFIIFMGNYMSPQFFLQNRFNPYNIKKLFDKLADIIFGYKKLRTTTHFVFGSGTYDYFYADTFPVPPIPPTMVSRLTKVLTHVTFTSNLVNLRYYGRDIKIYRSDLYKTIMTRDQQQYNGGSSSSITNAASTGGDNIFSQSKLIPDDVLPPDVLNDRKKREARKLRELERQNRGNQHGDSGPKHTQFDDDENDDMNHRQRHAKGSSNTTMASTEHHNHTTLMSDLHHDPFIEQPVFGDDDDDDDNNGVEMNSELELEQEQTRFISDIVVNHLTSQDTLIPDILHQPLLWDYSQAYQLTVLPDALFIIDLVKSYNVLKYGTLFYNTGAFTGEWGFVQYFPATNSVVPLFL